MFLRRCLSLLLFAGILTSWVTRAAAQQTVPLMVDPGRPIGGIVTQTLRYKLNEPVHPRVTEPIFAFDREVIPSGAEVTGLAGGIGFGLIGSALGRWFQPVSSILGFYGAGRLAYSNIIGRGQEITFPKNTPVEIRFSSRDETH